jgi:hypothetical protein
MFKYALKFKGEIWQFPIAYGNDKSDAYKMRLYL